MCIHFFSRSRCVAIGTARPGSSPSNPYRLMFVPSGLLNSSSSEDKTESVSEFSDTRDPPIGDFDSEPMDTTSLKFKNEKRHSDCLLVLATGLKRTAKYG